MLDNIWDCVSTPDGPLQNLSKEEAQSWVDKWNNEGWPKGKVRICQHSKSYPDSDGTHFHNH